MRSRFMLWILAPAFAFSTLVQASTDVTRTECELEGEGLKAELRCEVDAITQDLVTAGLAAFSFANALQISIVCTDGFDLFDSTPRPYFGGSDLSLVKATEEGRIAFLEVHETAPDIADAELVTSWNGRSTVLQGTCRRVQE